MCEVNAGGLTYATTGDLLAMVAPRWLLVVNASRDALQFSAEEAAKSLGYARTGSACWGKKSEFARPSSPRGTITASRCARPCTAGSNAAEEERDGGPWPSRR